jgi:hypothetical protein
MHSHQLAAFATGVHKALKHDSDGIWSKRGGDVNGITFISGRDLDNTDNDSPALGADDGSGNGDDHSDHGDGNNVNDATDASDTLHGLHAAANAAWTAHGPDRGIGSDSDSSDGQDAPMRALLYVQPNHIAEVFEFSSHCHKLERMLSKTS